MSRFFSIFLRQKKIRSKIIAYLREEFFHEIGYSMPVDNNYWAHLLEKDSYDSFSEIFIQREYLDFIPDEPISRILDIGAHYGYFSLWLQSTYPEIELASLMIEPSPSCTRSLKKLINQKKLGGRFSYLQGAIGSPGSERTTFYDRSHMASSRFPSSESEKKIQVKYLSEKVIMKKLEPPYDLIKCDIEGSEWEFLNNYQNLIKKSKFLLLEWHSWHDGGAGLPQIEKFILSLDFNVVRSSESIPAVGREGEVGLILLRNHNHDCS